MGEAPRPRWRVALAWAARAFAVCSLLPLWELWYVGSWEASIERGPLWWVLWHVAWPDPPPGEWPLLRAGCQTGAAITAVVVAVAGLLGFWLAGRDRPRTAMEQDYDDAAAEPGGAPDKGRDIG